MTRYAAGPSVSAFFADSPQYGVISDKLMQAKSQQRQAATQAESFVERSGLDSMARIRSAEAQARATAAGAQADASATRAQGMSKMIGSIAGGIGKMDFGGPPESPGIGTGAEFGEVGTMGSDMYDFHYTPAEDIAFNDGTGVYWETP